MNLQIPGQLFLLWAFGANILAGLAFFLAARGKRQYLALGRLSYHLFTVATTLAVAWLFYLFFTHNFAFKYVFEYSDTKLPFFFLLSAFWGGQEGTYLLWMFLSALFGYIILKRGGQYTNYAMGFYALVNLFFSSILLKLSPFAYLGFPAAEGAGLNPLLQDAWMVVHPPIMFVGYAMAALPFVLALAALATNDYSDWVKRVFPWAAVTALMLAAGNILGGYWAYKTLGWGGYWAWDPVENSSLIPWFMSLALLHGLIIERRGGALRKINMLLAAGTFWLVIWGTFMTRSGVLSDFSVHSFVDLGQNFYLIGALLLYAIVTIVMFVPRIKAMGNVPLNYNFFGREFSLFAAMTLLFAFAMVVYFWSSLPILLNIVGAEPRAADISTYNSFALPIGVIYALLLLISPMLSWTPTAPKKWMGTAIAAGGGALVLGIVAALLTTHADMVFAVVFALIAAGLAVTVTKSDTFKKVLPSLIMFVLVVVLSFVLGVRNYLYSLFFATAAAAFTSNIIAFFRYIPGQWRIAGGHLTHFGFGLMLIGVLASSAFDTSDRIVLPQNTPEKTFGLQVTYEGMANDIDYPHNELILSIQKGNSKKEARPELYFSERMQGLMKRPYIRRSPLYDLYFSPQDIRQASANQGLVIGKGKAATAGGWDFLFDGFQMGQHNAGSGSMKVTATIIASRDGLVDTLTPSVAMIADTTTGENTLMDMPARFGEGSETYMMSIQKILADQGAVAVDIPGLTDQDNGDQLLMDISRKPLINLVWVGTTFIMLGTLIVFFRRRRESLTAA